MGKYRIIRENQTELQKAKAEYRGRTWYGKLLKSFSNPTLKLTTKTFKKLENTLLDAFSNLSMISDAPELNLAYNQFRNAFEKFLNASIKKENNELFEKFKQYVSNKTYDAATIETGTATNMYYPEVSFVKFFLPYGKQVSQNKLDYLTILNVDSDLKDIQIKLANFKAGGIARVKQWLSSSEEAREILSMIVRSMNIDTKTIEHEDLRNLGEIIFKDLLNWINSKKSELIMYDTQGMRYKVFIQYFEHLKRQASSKVHGKTELEKKEDIIKTLKKFGIKNPEEYMKKYSVEILENAIKDAFDEATEELREENLKIAIEKNKEAQQNFKDVKKEK